ncbi:MAG: hypothetical protein AAF851_16055 [Myxococcota bacterium]
MLLSGCWTLEPEARPPKLGIRTLSPEALGPRDALLLELDQAVDGWAGPSGLQGLDDYAVSTTEYPNRFLLRPIDRWPLGRLELRLGTGWFDEEGRPLLSRSSTRAVTVFDEASPPSVQLRAPLAARAPTNLRWLVLNAPAAEALHHSWGRAQVAARSGSELRVEIPAQAAGRFDLSVDGSTVSLELTAPPDLEPPELGPLELHWSARGAVLAWTVNEPVWIEARLDASVLPVGAPLVWVGRGQLELPIRRPSEFELRIVDLSGNRSTTGPLTLVPGPRLDLAITELVATPLRDWGDSEPAGLPYDASPGYGAVTSTDEWVELVNLGDELDLSALRIEVEAVDGTPAVTVLPGAPGAYFGSGGSWARWQSGEALVLRLRGAMSSQELELRVRSGATLLDAVTLGEPGQHPGGSPPDPVHEAIARTEAGWRWCRPTPGDPRPSLECVSAGP